MGSVIFPESKLKIYLTASTETRAERRYNQLKDRGFNVSLPALIKDLDARDKRDRERDNSPLVIPEGASVIETDNLKIIQVKELPVNAPESFNGAVGDFELDLRMTKTDLNASESLQATVEISGKGNLKLFSSITLSESSEYVIGIVFGVFNPLFLYNSLQ